MMTSNIHDIVIPPAFETSEDFSPENVLPVDLADFESVEPAKAVGEVPVPKRFQWGFRPRRTRGTAYDLFSKRYRTSPENARF